MLKKSDIWSGRIITLKASPSSGPFAGHNWPAARVRALELVGNNQVKIEYISKTSLDREDDGTRIVNLTDLELR